MKIRGLPSLGTYNIRPTATVGQSAASMVGPTRGFIHLFRGTAPSSMEDIPFQIDGGPNEFSFDGSYGFIENSVGCIPVDLTVATSVLTNDTLEIVQSSPFNYIEADKIVSGLSGLILEENGTLVANTAFPDFKAYAIKFLQRIGYPENSTYQNTKQVYTLHSSDSSACLLPNLVFRNQVQSSNVALFGYSPGSLNVQQWNHIVLDQPRTVDCFVCTHGSDNVFSSQRIYIDYWDDNTNTWIRTNVAVRPFYSRAEAIGSDSEVRTFYKITPVTAKLFRIIVTESQAVSGGRFHYLKQVALGSTTDLTPVTQNPDPITWALLAPHVTDFNFNSEPFATRADQRPFFLLTVGDAAATGVNLKLDKLVFDHSTDYDYPSLLDGSMTLGQ